MITYLLDTNVISEPVRPRPSVAVVERLAAQGGLNLFTSAVCVMELRHGAMNHPRRDMFWNELKRRMLDHLKILPLTTREAIASGEILAELRRTGQSIGEPDVMIGATALVHGHAIVTRNVDHFRRIRGLRVVDWFADEA